MGPGQLKMDDKAGSWTSDEEDSEADSDVVSIIVMNSIPTWMLLGCYIDTMLNFVILPLSDTALILNSFGIKRVEV